MKASGKKFQEFVDAVHKALPEGFSNSISAEGLTMGATAYAFIAFMRGGSAENCARDLEVKLGVEEDEVDVDITNWEDEGGNV